MHGQYAANTGTRMEARIKIYDMDGVCDAFTKSPRTVRRWIQNRLLVPRYQLISGHRYKLVFLQEDLLKLVDSICLTEQELNSSRTPRAQLIRKLRDRARLFGGKASARKVARECGISEEDEDIESQEDTNEEVPILDHKPERNIGTTRE